MSELATIPGGRGGFLRPPWRKGESGNPAGRKTAGAYISEWVNALTYRQVNEKTLRRIMRRKSSPVALKVAANRLLAMMERPDIADFEPLLDGQMSARELRAAGIDTAMIKKLEPKKTKITRRKKGEEEIIEEVSEAKIELFDRSLPSFEKTLDRTDGAPSQAVKIDHSISEIKRIEVTFSGDANRTGNSQIAATGGGLPLLVDGAEIPLDTDGGGARDGEIGGASDEAGTGGT